MKTVLIIANPKAGKGKPIKNLELVQNLIKNLGYDFTTYLTQTPADYKGIEDAIRSNIDCSHILIMGGDGTLNDVINSIPENFYKLLIVLPCGSGNDFATYLYPNQSIREILQKLNKNESINVNIALCNGKRFINGLGIGFDGWVAKKASTGVLWLPPFLKYHLAILRGLFTFKSFYSSIGSSLIIAIANAPTYGGGFRVAPGADAMDNLLDLWQIKPIHFFKRPYFLNLIKKGGHANINGPFSHQTITEITIQSHQILPAHLDGEYFEAEKFEVKLLEMKVKFVV